ncbi:MAG: glucuronate isomerase, partial [Propionibacteriaceae bacterium]|nr:glucuronate isomerase [Propionibacteriaceae bacterium]
MALPLLPDPDRLFPTEPTTRQIARRLYESIKDLPILSPHGHVPAAWIADNLPFTDPVSLLLSPDHYITRLLHADGVSLASLGVPPATTPLTEAQARAAWRTFCIRWPLFRGTPMKFWMESVLAGVFGSRVRPSAETADQIYDYLAAELATPAYRPRALLDRFNIEFLATTDDPCDDLASHTRLAADLTFHRRVVPTFRPDRYLEPARPEWPGLVARLGEVAGVSTATYAGWVAAMENRRAYFKAHGAVSSDHSHLDVQTLPLARADAETVYAAALAGEATPAAA